MQQLFPYFICVFFLFSCGTDATKDSSTKTDPTTEIDAKAGNLGSNVKENALKSNNRDGMEINLADAESQRMNLEKTEELRNKIQAIKEKNNKIIRASGNDPNWILFMSEKDGVRFVSSEVKLNMPFITPEESSGSKTYSATSDKGEFTAVFSNSNNSCVDPRGNKFPYNVNVQIGETKFTGCGGNRIIMKANQ